MSPGPQTCAPPINSAGETPRKLQTCLCYAPRITSLLRSETDGGGAGVEVLSSWDPEAHVEAHCPHRSCCPQAGGGGEGGED